MVSSKKIKIEAVDLFCGVGGLSYGMQKNNINVLAGIDIDDNCRFAYEKNNHPAFFIHEDITKFDFKSLNSLFSKNSYKVLIGCAPCQPFSPLVRKKKEDNY